MLLQLTPRYPLHSHDVVLKAQLFKVVTRRVVVAIDPSSLSPRVWCTLHPGTRITHIVITGVKASLSNGMDLLMDMIRTEPPEERQVVWMVGMIGRCVEEKSVLPKKCWKWKEVTNE